MDRVKDPPPQVYFQSLQVVRHAWRIPNLVHAYSIAYAPVGVKSAILPYAQSPGKAEEERETPSSGCTLPGANSGGIDGYYDR